MFVVEDDLLIRKSLCWLVQSIGLAVREYPSAAEFLSGEYTSGPGCIVADVRLPQMSGVELLLQVGNQPCPRPVILITGHADVPLAVRAMRSGAFDFLEKPCNDQLLLERIQEAIHTDRAHRVRFAEREAATARVGRLSPREREVLLLILRGLANKEVARRLGLSIKTVETHRAKVCQKLECDHIAGLARLARLAGLDGDSDDEPAVSAR